MEVGFLFGAGAELSYDMPMVENLRWIFLEEIHP